jgi:cytochrome c553
MKKSMLFVMTSWAILSVTTMPANAEGNIEAGKEKSAACVACHGMDGNSFAPMWPKLAGQSPNYIKKQLTDFKAERRTDPSMAPMVKPLSEQDIKDLAAYFSSQTVKPGSSSQPDLVDLGKQIYRNGKKPQVTACVGCHGLKGKGNYVTLTDIGVSSIVEAPAIGSQHAEYITKQLKAFKDKSRANDVDNVMQKIVKGLNEQEIEAVAQYIAGLN